MIVSYFDYFIIAILILVNIKYWSNDLLKKYGCVLAFVFLILLPLISIEIEFKIKEEENRVCFDAFTMAYVFFKFPLYWGIFILQGIVNLIKPTINRYFFDK